MKYFILFTVGAVVIVAGAIAAEVVVWRECRTTHSWLFCARVFGR